MFIRTFLVCLLNLWLLQNATMEFHPGGFQMESKFGRDDNFGFVIRKKQKFLQYSMKHNKSFASQNQWELFHLKHTSVALWRMAEKHYIYISEYMYICICIYVHNMNICLGICIPICIYRYIWREREKKANRERNYLSIAFFSSKKKMNYDVDDVK